MQLIDHPEEYTTGCRVLFLKGRHKDGIEDERLAVEITHDSDHFKKMKADLVSRARPSERLYVSAAPRSLEKAVRQFKQWQLDNDYAAKPLEFYQRLERRWISSLMAQTSVERELKLWMFDCDTPQEYLTVREMLQSIEVQPYVYNSKSGQHVVVRPFNQLLAGSLRTKIDTNPLMLWGY